MSNLMAHPNLSTTDKPQPPPVEKDDFLFLPECDFLGLPGIFTKAFYPVVMDQDPFE